MLLEVHGQGGNQLGVVFAIIAQQRAQRLFHESADLGLALHGGQQPVEAQLAIVVGAARAAGPVPHLQRIQRLLHRYLGVGLVIFLMYLTGVGLLVFSFTQLLAPVYVFPEWVPAILVEPKEIAATFWNNQSAANSLLSLRSRELLFLNALRGYILILTALAGALLITPLGKLLKVFKKTE